MKTVFNLLLCSIVSLTLGCKKKTYPESETVTLALTQAPKSLDPRFTTDATGQRINQLIYNSLVKVGKKMQVEGDASTHWQLNNLTYTFYLQKDLSFSDGTPLINKDIYYTFSEFQKSSSPFKSAFDIIESVNADIDGNEDPTIKITLKKFSANFLLDLSLIRFLKADKPNEIIGTGAFKLLSQNLNEIVLEKREHPIYKPKIKYAVFKIILDDATRFLNAYKGSIDIIQYGLPLSKISYIKKRDKYLIYSYPGPSMNYILINFKKKIFNNLEFRKALAMAINRKEIIDYKLEGFAVEATSLLPTNNIFHNNNLENIPHNILEAKKIIKNLKLDGTTIELKTSNNPEVVEFSKIISNQLRQVGINLKIQSYEWGTFYGDIGSGNYELATMRWVGLSDPDIYRTAFHSKEFPPGRNRGFYSNHKLDQMLDEGISIRNLQKRISFYNSVQKIIYEDYAIIPLWYNTLVDIVHKRIKNYIPPDNGDLSPLYEIEISNQE